MQTRLIAALAGAAVLIRSGDCERLRSDHDDADRRAGCRSVHHPVHNGAVDDGDVDAHDEARRRDGADADAGCARARRANLRGRRTATGYTLSGQALVKDACTAARFDQFLGDIFPPQYNLNQFRRPGTMGMLCIQRLTWVTAMPKSVTSAAPPRYVTVRTQKGRDARPDPMITESHREGRSV